jgi:hypothetical protein
LLIVGLLIYCGNGQSRLWTDELRQVGEQPRVEPVAEQTAERRRRGARGAKGNAADIARLAAWRLTEYRPEKNGCGQEVPPREAAPAV